MHTAAISPFKIKRELGGGGMEEVCLADDTQLDRPVAALALPANLAQDHDRLARFQRETNLLAPLTNLDVKGRISVAVICIAQARLRPAATFELECKSTAGRQTRSGPKTCQNYPRATQAPGGTSLEKQSHEL
jgi:hypothetical protein